MCRFVAFLGKEFITLDDILLHPKNSLVRQSIDAREEGRYGLNADGFGIGWYNTSGDPNTPGAYKSVQPAWNDYNLKHLISKVRATCLFGHVRASSVGDVALSNCHPFYFKQYLFMHNGNIAGFHKIQRDIQEALRDETFNIIHGHTDSEHFFALWMNYFFEYAEGHHNDFSLNAMHHSFEKTIKKIHSLQHKYGVDQVTSINAVLTDGKQMFASRYISHQQKTGLSLHYVLGSGLSSKGHGAIMHPTSQSHPPAALIICSEKLDDHEHEWKSVPNNHTILVDESFSVTLKEIKV
jgi:glutamine amidotransferase